MDTNDLNSVGRHTYRHCAHVALENVRFMRELMDGDVTDENHELPLIEQKLVEILDVA